MNEAIESSFLKHSKLILQDGYSATEKIGSLVLSLYNGNAFPFDCSSFRALDEHHYAIALELIDSYYRNGENDEEFMKLAEDLKEFRKARAEAKAKVLESDD
jgi:hypothetical protein